MLHASDAMVHAICDQEAPARLGGGAGGGREGGRGGTKKENRARRERKESGERETEGARAPGRQAHPRSRLREACDPPNPSRSNGSCELTCRSRGGEGQGKDTSHLSDHSRNHPMVANSSEKTDGTVAEI
eukprot:755749-Hanusia_phi.AAC.4